MALIAFLSWSWTSAVFGIATRRLGDVPYVPAEQAFSYRCSEPLSLADVKLGALPSRRRLMKSRPSTHDFQGELGRDPPMPYEVQRRRRASLPLSSNPPFPTIPVRVSSLGYLPLFHIKIHYSMDGEIRHADIGYSGRLQTLERVTQRHQRHRHLSRC
jgi:hypothetical protein